MPRDRRFRLTLEEIDRRRRTIAALSEYLDEHGISRRHLVRRVSVRLGGPEISASRIDGMRKGFCPIPAGFIQAAFEELEKPVKVVMGPAWLERDGPHFGFSAGDGACAGGQAPSAA